MKRGKLLCLGGLKIGGNFGGNNPIVNLNLANISIRYEMYSVDAASINLISKYQYIIRFDVALNVVQMLFGLYNQFRALV